MYLVGARVSVYWPGERLSYIGQITRISKQGRYRVYYDDGDVHWEDIQMITAVCVDKPDTAGGVEPLGVVIAKVRGHGWWFARHAVDSDNDGRELLESASATRTLMYFFGTGKFGWTNPDRVRIRVCV